MKDLPRKKTVQHLEEEDIFLEEYSIKNEEAIFTREESKLKKMLKAIKVTFNRPINKKPKKIKKQPIINSHKKIKRKIVGNIAITKRSKHKK